MLWPPPSSIKCPNFKVKIFGFWNWPPPSFWAKSPNFSLFFEGVPKIFRVFQKKCIYFIYVHLCLIVCYESFSHFEIISENPVTHSAWEVGDQVHGKCVWPLNWIKHGPPACDHLRHIETKNKIDGDVPIISFHINAQSFKTLF